MPGFRNVSLSRNTRDLIYPGMSSRADPAKREKSRDLLVKIIEVQIPKSKNLPRSGDSTRRFVDYHMKSSQQEDLCTDA